MTARSLINEVVYLSAVVCFNECLCGLIVDDDAVDFAAGESCNGVSTLGECLNMILAEAAVLDGIGSIGVAGGCDLAADLDVLALLDLCNDVVSAGDIGIFLDDYDLTPVA